MMPADTEVSSSIDKAELLRRLHAILPAASLLHDPEELSHLQAGSSLPVRHWIELIDAVLAGTLQAHSPAEQSTLLATGSPMTAHPNPKPTPVKGGFGEQRSSDGLQIGPAREVVSGHIADRAVAQQANPVQFATPEEQLGKTMVIRGGGHQV